LREECVVRIYFFDAMTGIYQGEAFEEERLAERTDGVTNIPPPVYPSGQIPVYDQATACWTLVSTDDARQLAAGSTGDSRDQ